MTREEFVSIPRLAVEVTLKSEALQTIRSAAVSLPSLQLGYRVQQGTHSDRVGSFAGRITDLEQELLQVTARLAELRLEALQLLRALPDPEQSILQLRYVAGLKWGRIAEEMDREESYIHRRHKAALNKLFDDTDAPGTNTHKGQLQDDN